MGCSYKLQDLQAFGSPLVLAASDSEIGGGAQSLEKASFDCFLRWRTWRAKGLVGRADRSRWIRGELG